MAVIGSIAIALGLDTAKFQKELKASRRSLESMVRKMKRNFKNLGTSIANVTKSVAKWGTALGVAAAGGMALLIKSTLNAIDTLGKVSSKLGASTEGLVSLRLAAEEMSAIGSGAFDTALQRMTRRVAEAAAGTGEAKKALETLGLNASRLNTLTADEKFIEIAEAMKGVHGEANQLAIAFKLFDTEGAGLVNTLRLGREGLEKYKDDAEKLGLTLSAKAAKGAEAANDAIGRLFKLLGGLKTQTVAALAPAIEKAVKAFNNWILGIAQANGGIQNLGKTIAISLLTAIKNVAIGFQNVINLAQKTAVSLGLIEDKRKADLELLNAELAKYDEILERYERLKIEADTTGILKARQIILDGIVKLQNEENTAMGKGIAFIQQMIDETNKLNVAKGGGSGGGNGAATAAAGEAARVAALQEAFKKQQQLRDVYLKKGIEQLDQSLMTEVERIRSSIYFREQMVEDAVSRNLISKQRATELLVQIHKDGEKKMTEASKKESESRLKVSSRMLTDVSSILMSLSQMNEGASRKQFEKNKRLQKYSVIASTAAGIMRAYSDLGPIAGSVAALAIGASGKVQLNNIKRMQWGGGGGSISIPTVPTQAEQTTIDQSTTTSTQATYVFVLHDTDDYIVDTVKGFANKSGGRLLDDDAPDILNILEKAQQAG